MTVTRQFTTSGPDVSASPGKAASPFPLSAAQHGLWLAQQLNPDAPICEAQYVELRGKLDIELLRTMSRQAGHEFESPYLRLIEVDGQPSQVLDLAMDLRMRVIDMRGEPDPFAAGLRWMRQEYTAHVDLVRDPLICTAILVVGDQHFLWYSRVHHIALDGYAAMTMLNRVAALYTAAVRGEQAPASRTADLRTLYEADRSYRESKRFTDDKAYWVNRLADVGAESSLANGSAPAHADSATVSAELSTTTAQRLGQVAEAWDASAAAVVIAAFGCYLARMTGRDEVLVNVPVLGRTTALLRRSGGMFVNVVPLPIALDAADTVSDVVHGVQKDLVGALRHQRFGLTDIRAATGRHGQQRFAGPVVNVMLFPQQVRLGSLTGEFHILTSGPVDDLLVDVYQRGIPARTVVAFLANPDRYSGARLSRQHSGFLEFLDEFVAAASGAGLEQIHPDSVREGDRVRRRRKDLEFWRAALADLPVELPMPVDRPRPAVASNQVDTTSVTVDSGLMAALDGLARRRGMSLFEVLHGASAVLLARLSGGTDISIGTLAAARDGPAGNPVVLRTDVDPTERFTTLLDRIEQVDRDAFGHAGVRFDEVLEAVAPQRFASRHPLFQVMLVFRDHDSGDGPDSDLSTVDPADPRVDLQIVISDRHNHAGVTAALTYATDLFDATTIDTLARRWTRILEFVAADPCAPVDTIDLLEAGERTDLVSRSGPPAAEPVVLPDLLTSAAARDPDVTAVVSGDRRISYRELDARSNQLARMLVDRGVGPEDIVAVGLPRSLESVLAIWAITKTGAAFLPFDPTLPAHRVGHVVTDSRATTAIATQQYWLPVGIRRLAFDEFDNPDTDSGPITDADRVIPLRPQHPAYVIYTSGTTGVPKGVTVTHTGLASLVAAHREAMAFESGSRTVHLASPSFDVSVLEMVVTLAAGATLVIAPDVYGGDELGALLARDRITHLFITPSALSTIDPAGFPLPDLSHLVVGGEVAGTGLIERWSRDRAMFNEYGPTEATIVSTLSAALVGGGLVSVGGPIRGVSAWVLDRWLRPVPVGVAGELYVSGGSLARGYHGRAGLTAGSFVACPWVPGGRMYRTGDVVRWAADGAIQHLGRGDDQVKVRGVRVELGEVDAVLAGHDTVGFAVTVGCRRSPDSAGLDSLVSYVVAAPDCAIDTGVLVEHAAARLPAAMVPAAIVALDHVPLTPTGKLDRKALPDPVFADETVFRAPETPVQRAIAEQFGNLLGMERVGLDDSFFALGGNSLLATRLAARLAAALDTEVPVRLLFEAPTVAALAARLAPKAGSGQRRPPLTAVARPDVVPLAPAQQRMWFLNQYDTGSGAYNVPIAIRLRGDLNIDALRLALRDVLGRHESLRTRYPEHDGTLRQLIEPVDAVDLDLTPTPVAPDELITAIGDVGAAGFDVSTQIPVRVRLFAVAAAEHVVIVVVHHIAADGFSMIPLARDAATAYAARVRGQAPEWAPLPIQYADYALWQQRVLGSPDDPQSLSADQIRYWTAALDGIPLELRLPVDRPRPMVTSNRAGTVTVDLDAGLVEALNRVARGQGASLFMVVHSALAVLLARLGDSTDIPIGTPVAGRGAAVLDDVIGMLVNTVVLRTRFDPGETFTALLDRVKHVDLDAFAHADVPFEQLVEVLAPERSQARHPLFQVLLAFQNLEPVELELPGLSLSVVDLPNAVSGFDLQVVIADNHPGMTATLTYAMDLFDADTVETLARRWIRVLESVAADPAVPVATVDILTPAEQTDLVTRSGPPAQVPVLLPDLLAAAAARRPENTAVVFEDRRLSYRELDERSNQLARVLIGRGIGPEDVVALGLSRSVESILAVWAVAKAGAAFLPVDPAYPARRVAHMLADSAAAVVVTTSAYRFDLPGTVDRLDLDDPGLPASAAAVTDADRVAPLHSRHPAYLVYTSGTTGIPKGVTVTHTGLASLVAEQRERYGLSEDARTLHVSSPSFDASVWELLMAVGSSSTMVIAAPGTYGGAELAELLRRERVTHIEITPAALASVDPAGLDDLRVVVVAGEACPAELVRCWASDDREFYNAYGPTEASVQTNASASLVGGALVSVGGPIYGVSEWVLDRRLRPVPVGVAGELYVSGGSLARGYHGRAGLTAGCFVACPWAAGERMYRTGDVVRWTADGAIQHLGRGDDQVKIRGMRIELGEVDAALAGHDTVGFAVTVGCHRIPDGAEWDSLASYVVAAPGRTVDTTVLAQYLEGLLPSNLVPAAITALDDIPLTPVGKLDRKALPDPVFADETVFRPPETLVQQIVAEQFAEMLGMERVGLDGSFFALGGNSLLATRVAARLAVALDTEVPVRLLFEAPTVAALAARLEPDVGAGRHGPSLTAVARPDVVPLAPAQQRMWFLNQYDTGSGAYNVPIAIRLHGDLNIDALRLAVVDVLGRHESLRTRYPERHGTLVQLIEPVDTVDLDLTPTSVAPEELPTAVAGVAVAGLDVSAQIPVRVRLFAVAAAEHVVVVVVHHIVADGFSMIPLARDVATAYAARARGQAPEWAPLPIQYADYALWQRRVLGSPDDPQSLSANQIRYWTEALDGLAPELPLPVDRPRPMVTSNRAGTVTVDLDAGLVEALNRVARGQNASLFMVVHSALAVLLARLGDSTDIPIGTPVAGRGAAVLDDVIGMFVNTVVLRTGFDPGETFTALLDRVKHVDLDAFAHADVPFEQLVEVLAPERSQARHPLFQVLLAFQNLEPVELELPGLSLSVVDLPNAVSGFDLQVVIADNHPGMTATLTYAMDLFDADTVETLARRWIRVLESVAADPAVPVAAIDILTPAEHSDLVTRSGPPVPAPVVLPELLGSAAARHPDNPAVVSGENQISYRELDERSNQLARVLIGRGIGPEDVVALGLSRSVESVLAVWAVAKAGAAFLPVDPAYPARRVAHMLADSGAALVVTTSAHRLSLPESVDRLDLDEPVFAATAAVADADRVAPLHPQHPAYLIYTSGTTGVPKGVTVTHTGLAGLVAGVSRYFGLRPASRVLGAASPSFDVSILEWLGAACSAATLVLAPESVVAGDELGRVIAAHRVTHVAVTPTVLASMDPEGLDTLETIVLGGEVVSADLVARWEPRCRLVNTYGATETTIMACADTTGRAASLGGPVHGFTALVLDHRLRPVPPGVVGELYLSGPGLARGYHRQPVMTAACFVANLYGAPGDRLYRTGDLVAWAVDGTLGYRGRGDLQIKIHGHRIEPGDVETALRAHPAVANAAVTVRTTPSGVDQLVGYVVPVDNAVLEPAALTADLLHRLPTPMVPTTITVLDHIPLTPSGKLDHEALPAPDPAPAARSPETGLEAILAQLYAEVLGVDTVGADDNFFTLGGDSIMSIRLVARARAAGVVFSARDVFDRKTVAGLARIAVRDGDAATVAAPAELPGGGVGPVPLTPVMTWMLERGGGFHRFSQWVMLTLPAGIDEGGIAATVQAVLDRHDMLRSRLRPDAAAPVGWALRVDPTATPAGELVRRVPVDAEPGSAAFAEIAAAEVTAAAGRLDPTAGIMLQLLWFDRAGQPGRLLVVAHHLVVDHVSWQILIPDLVAAWSSVSVGQPPRLAPVGTSMRRWTHALHAAANSCDELDWWRDVLAAADPPIGSRPLDPAVDVRAATGTVDVTFPSSLTNAALTTLPRVFHGSVNDGLLAGLALALMRWRRQRGSAVTDTLLTMESHGRHDAVLPGADLTRTVGWFTSAYPVRLRLADIDIDDAFAAGDAAGAVVKSVKEQLRRVPNHGIGYGLLRYLNPDTARTLRAQPAPQVNFNYLGRVDTLPATPRDVGWMPTRDGTDAGSVQDPDAPVPAALDINAIVIGAPTGATLTAAWTFPSGVLSAAEVGGLARLWREAVTALAEYAAKPGAGGLTPSDVDLVPLDQAAIDQLEARYPTASDIWPLTPLQSGLLFQAEFADTLDPYLVQLCVELAGQLDTDRLRHAARALLDRYPNLRTAFVHNNVGDPVQVVQEDLDVPFTRIDLTEHDDAAELDELMAADRRIRFDMTAAPLLRLTMIGISPQRCRLVLSMHHILIDGWSTPLLVRELLTLYLSDGDPAALDPVRRPYRDYLAWLGTQDRAAAEAAWARALADVAEPTQLASADVGRRHTAVAREVQLELNHSRTAVLAGVARRQETTLNTVVEAAWGIVLGTMTSRDDVVFGTTVSGRPPQISGIESMIGLFVNTVPVRIRLDQGESLAELLRRIHVEQASLLDHHHLGLSRIQQVAGPGATFDTMTVFESYPVDTAGLSADTDVAGLRVLDVHGHDAAHYPLGLIVHHDGRLRLTLKYLPESFTEYEVEIIGDLVLHVLDAIAEHVDLPLAQLRLLTAAQHTDLVTRSGPAAPAPVVLPELLAAAVARHPDNTAVVSGDRRLSYRELDERSNQLARVLISRGIGPEDIVTLGLSRSVESVLAVWAVAKAGAAFLPVDPAYPARRVAHMLADSGAALVVTTSAYRLDLPDTVDRLDLDDPALPAAIAAVADADRVAPLHPQHPAYLIYTSGTTGVPKGVTVTHTGLAGLVAGVGRYFGLRPASRVLGAASPSFDVSILEWLGAACSAATLVLAPESVVAGDELGRVIAAHRVTHVAVTPTVLASMDPEGLDTLETIVLGGEVVSADLVARWEPRCRLVNTYGATETTIMACADTTGRAASLGGPVHGFTALVLDHRLRPVPPGVVGELYLSGPGLARGYHRQPVMTAACFVANLYGAPGDRLYRTGDLVAWAVDGTLGYRGRGDLQIKIHGHRIEPGDVETALRAHPAVANAAVTVRTTPSGVDQLVGYVVPVDNAVLEPAALTADLLHRLPTPMVPTTITVLDHIPLTPSGKLDHEALPAPDPAPAARSPETGLEAILAQLYAEVLGVDTVGADDNFFTLGGDSLTAAALAARTHDRTGRTVPVQWVFTDPTPRSLARRIEDGRGVDPPNPDEALSVLLPLRTGGTEPPLFCVHPAIGLAWGFSGLVQHLDPDCPVYGLQSPTLTDPTTEYDTLRQLAARYVQEIRSVQRHGPYHLLGYSLGGTIAHEIAVQLRHDGAEVATLAMMDTRVVTDSDVRRPTPTIEKMLTEFAGIDNARIPADLTVEAATDLLRGRGGLFIALTPHHLTTLHRDYTRLVELTRQHRPACFDGDLLYFAADDDTTDDVSPAAAWSRHVTGHIEEHHISVRHERMIDPEAFSAIGLVLTRKFHSASAHLEPTTTRRSRS